MFNSIYQLYQTLDSFVIFSFLSYTLLILCGFKEIFRNIHCNHIDFFLYCISLFFHTSIHCCPLGTLFYLPKFHQCRTDSLLVLFCMRYLYLRYLCSYFPGRYSFFKIGIRSVFYDIHPVVQNGMFSSLQQGIYHGTEFIPYS